MPQVSSKFIQVHIARFNENRSEHEYLVLKRAKNVIPYPGLWQVVTGNIEKNEKSIETAIREVYEETALKPNKIWILPYVTTFFNAYKDVVYMSPVFGILVSNNKVRLSDEHSEYEWLDYQSCYNKLELPSHKEAHKIFRDHILDNDSNAIYKYIIE
jgi:dihydroneopterin triphosphate diphosphatase